MHALRVPPADAFALLDPALLAFVFQLAMDKVAELGVEDLVRTQRSACSYTHATQRPHETPHASHATHTCACKHACTPL